jgi:glycosyltransferase involved in cell wall biosynthesis
MTRCESMATSQEQPFVSIVTPCFNGARYVHRFLDSVLGQTYRNIELVFVNDGSVDNTEQVALSYGDRLEKRGIRFVYIYQDNQGAAAALNQGLRVFQGEYLTWPDSDDTLHRDNIRK